MPLPTALLHVRRIVLFCSVSPYDVHKFVVPHDSSARDRASRDDTTSTDRYGLLADYVFSDDDEHDKNKPMRTQAEQKLRTRAQQAKLVAEFFRHNWTPLVRHIAARFVRLQHFSVVLQWNDDRRIVYNVDKAVLAERMDKNLSADEQQRNVVENLQRKN